MLTQTTNVVQHEMGNVFEKMDDDGMEAMVK